MSNGLYPGATRRDPSTLRLASEEIAVPAGTLGSLGLNNATLIADVDDDGSRISALNNGQIAGAIPARTLWAIDLGDASTDGCQNALQAVIVVVGNPDQDLDGGGLETFNGSNVGTDSLLGCLLYTSPSPRDATLSRMPSSA